MVEKRSEISKVRLLWSLFYARKDVFARYWKNSATGKSGYSPVYDLQKNPAPLSVSFLQRHLDGQELLGIYPVLQDNSGYFLAIDFDGKNWFEEIKNVQGIAEQNGIRSYLERSKSGNGGHLWFFFEKAISAIKSRQLGKYFLSKVHITKSETSFGRFFPNQDEHTGKGFGNLIALPLNQFYAAIAEGNMTKKQREKITKRIKQHRFQLLIATGRLVGEGFDWPEVTHLFLAFPFSWKGKLIQYIGRVQRKTVDKKQAYIYDYIDQRIPMLKRMYFKRLRTYRGLGLIKNRTIAKKETIPENQLSLFSS